MFVLAHLGQAYDAVKRSGQAAPVVQAYQQMFSLMFDVVNQNKRRMEIIQMLTEIMNFLGITVFNELFDAGNFSK